MTTALEGGDGSASRPGRSLPLGKTRYPLYRRLVGPQGRSGQVQKISSSPGFDLRTVQPVASRYTDWATRPTGYVIIGLYIRCGNYVVCHIRSTWYAFVSFITILYQVEMFTGHQSLMDRERSVRDEFTVFCIVTEDIEKEEWDGWVM